SDVRNAISGQQFDLRLLPDTLEYGLSRGDLEKVQFTAIALPEHQREPQPRRGAVTVRVNRGKLTFHMLACVFWIVLYVMFWRFLFDRVPYDHIVFAWIFWVAGIVFALLLGFVAGVAIWQISVLGVALIRGGPLIVSDEGVAALLFNREL